MTKSIASDIIPVMARQQLQLDCSIETRNKLKSLAYGKGMSLREMVLRAIAVAHPEVSAQIAKELSE